MRIDQTIERWFRQTADDINSANKRDEPEYELCASILPLAHNYSDAALLLLNSGKKLPAMAIIRVVAELTFRFIWCLFPNKQNENVNVRIQRWLKKSYEQEIRNLKKRLPSADGKEQERIAAGIKYYESEAKKITYRSAGDLYGSLEDLTVNSPDNARKSLSWKNQLYPLLYTPFNQAVHPDLLVLFKLTKQTGNARMFGGDYDTVNINVLKIGCMSCVFNILAATRIVYDLGYQDIKKEYLEIKKQMKKE